MKKIVFIVVIVMSLAGVWLWFHQDPTEVMLREKAAWERKEAAKHTIDLNFSFSDKKKESGITFVHTIVDDAGKKYQANHYVHGNGVAAADIDGDGLVDLYFVNQLGKSALYKNLGNGKFKDITKEAGVGLGDRIAVSASFADIDNDGLPDLYVTSIRGGNVLFKNLGHDKFVDITNQAGVGYVGHSSASVFVDYNHDGLLDLLLLNLGKFTTDEKGNGGYYKGISHALFQQDPGEGNRLYKNIGNDRFADVTEDMGLTEKPWSSDAIFMDPDKSGYPDLYVLNMEGPNLFYKNDHGKGFTEQADRYFSKSPYGSMGVASLDFNNDGYMDVFVVDMHTDMDQPEFPQAIRWQDEKKKYDLLFPEYFRRLGHKNAIYGNALYRNDNNKKFTDVSDAFHAETYWPWGATVGDFNADGFSDVFIPSGMGYPFQYRTNSLLMNDHGKQFVDSEFLVGIEPRIGGKTDYVLYTIDCGKKDAASRRCDGSHGIVKILGTLSSRSSVAADLENDGDLDIVTNDFNGPPEIFMNNLSHRKNVRYIKIKLTGTISNREGLGSTVVVTAGGKSYTQYYDGKTGYLSQSALPLYFGLGDAKTIESIDVYWPSGKKTHMGKGPVNTMLEIREDATGE